jgi:hypothetical protein
VEFRILGPLEVRLGGAAVRVGGPRQRALLGLLLCHANRVVSRDQLIDELLRDQLAGSAEPVLHVQISRLRKALADGDPQPRLLARPPGYLLRVEDGELDLDAFEHRVAEGRRALEHGDPGRAQAAALIDPLTTGLPDRDHYVRHEARAEIDLLRGDVNAAARRHQRVKAITGPVSDMLYARESACRGTEVALWAGRPGDALDEVQQVFPLFKAPDLTILCGRLLAAGMRACADLAEQARARRDEPAAKDAAAAAEGLASWVKRMGGVPFTDHPYMATIPAERATWEAERTRLAGPSDPAAWGAAAKAWQDLGCPHRAGYAWWRRAQAQLGAGQPAAPAAAALRAALAAAHGHQPLLAQVRALAESARIPLHTPAAPRHRPTHVPPMGLPGASWRCCSSASVVLAQPRPGSVARRPRRPLGSRVGQQQCRARAWDGSLVRKEPTAQALPAEPAATPSRMLVAPRFGLPTCAHLVPFQCRISVLSPVPLAK